ncbi:MAG: hypothetical protein ACYC8V_05140 [Caulobacteraceae bacterium]
MKTRKMLIAALGLAMAAGAATAASADTPWQNHHPRREQVNDRLQNQNARIRQERREGEMSAMKAHRLHRADRRIRREGRRFAARDNGHITRTERARLNHQENQVGRRIGG